MTPRRTAPALVFALLAACRSVAAPTAPVAAPTRPPVAPLTAVAPSPAPPASPARCGDRDACLAEGVALLEDLLPRVDDDPDGARRTLRASRSPAARAWAAWLAHRAGDDADAEAVLAELATEGERPTLAPDDARGPGARALWLAREHVDLLAAEAPRLVDALPCAVFERDSAEAARAFGPVHGSTRDAVVAPFKRRCVTAVLDRHLGAQARAQALAADEALARALFRVWPQPAEGTLWVGVSIAAREVVRDSLLGVAPDDRATDVAMREVVGRLAADDPRALARVGSYRRAAEAQVGVFARTLCALAAARGRPMSGGQCTRRAYTVTLATFTTWVGALQGR